MAFARFHQGINDFITMTCSRIADKQPVFNSEFAGPDTLLGEVLVNASLRVIQVCGEFAPLGQYVVDRFSGSLRGLPETKFKFCKQHCFRLFERATHNGKNSGLLALPHPLAGKVLELQCLW